jgi:hypothetical protein
MEEKECWTSDAVQIAPGESFLATSFIRGNHDHHLMMKKHAHMFCEKQQSLRFDQQHMVAAY